jgi:hypothetical protein
VDTDKLNRWLALAANFGVLIGLILLVYEVRQNSDLMRAQISMERTNTNMQILADFANGGELIPIDVKLREEVKGFPKALGWSANLSTEERRRYEFWMFVRLVELNNDWFQCTEGFVPAETCRREVRGNMRRSLHRFYELGISFTRSESSFIAVMQELAPLEGLPEIKDDGSWK